MTTGTTDPVLGATLAVDYVPAANVRGAVAGATWRYLLPDMERRRVLCIGRPDPAAARALESIAVELAVVDGTGVGAVDDSVGGRRRRASGAGVEAWLAARPDASVDLVWVGRLGIGRHTATIVPRLARLLAKGGVIVCEEPASVAALASAAVRGERSGSPAFGRIALVDVAPSRGEIRSAVASGDVDMTASLAVRGLAATRPIRFVRVNRVLGRVMPSRRVASRRIAIAGEGATLPDVPAYIAEIAAAEGVDLAGHRCGLSANGMYNTQKVLYVVTPPDATEPSLVVKLTRDPSVNARLETERDALRRLESLGLADDGGIPRVRFAGRHAGLAVVGESAVNGLPLSLSGGADPVGRPIVGAIDQLIELGRRSVRTVAPSAVADALVKLHERYVAMCQPPLAEAERLQAAIAAIADSTSPFPVVFQHGDAGTWNLLVTPDQRVVFLDWENAEPAGMPLWDLFYLLRSHAVGVGRQNGARRRLTAVDRFLFDRSMLSELVVEATARSVAAIRLDPAMVEPLFHLCWMHQALKEATRFTPDRVRGAHFNRLLSLGLRRRDAPTLQRVFSIAP
jgi:hypothetical protein